MLGQRLPAAPALPRPPRRVAVPVAGFALGLLTGFLGVGGGFLVVPALVLLGSLPMHTAVGTSLFVIALSSAAGLAVHVHLGRLPPGLTAAFAVASLLGALAGVRLSASIDAVDLRRAFAVFVLLVGLALLATNV